ncbi:hypothetical protein KFZ76_12980 [Methylovulum psychrotolerans]|uniref:hypothetical protein n=1 Tax=Methylovulum psychrotolerans TaxID=1704499 RepID=UPI001BFF6129|nr:hypothetical protein [Methylovulum psychrotolerans]MBT9098615.1 hypothetical protein [Methylovulum psychrotolerans]
MMVLLSAQWRGMANGLCGLKPIGAVGVNKGLLRRLTEGLKHKPAANQNKPPKICKKVKYYLAFFLNVQYYSVLFPPSQENLNLSVRPTQNHQDETVTLSNQIINEAVLYDNLKRH